MSITHIEVLDDKGNARVRPGQLLTVTRETPAFFFVRAHDGGELKVSKRTARIIGSDRGFWRRSWQPTVNL